ncbi:MAG: hypothetical protein QOE11_3719 [Solirubrobacteraceae bacterium]|jgi:hypothetical protein|nr:hypothetical protein [Solirubrobacteraceae bacterium]
MRRLVSRLVPDMVLRAVSRRRTRRFLALVRPATEEHVRRHGLAVTRGPLTGLRFLPELAETSGDLVAKLVGTYEQELHPALEAWIGGPPGTIVDVGSAEGTYAVGLAVAIPQARVLAFDIDPAARARCNAMAELNGVAGRVEVRGACTHDVLNALAPGHVSLFVDCEGCELELLRPDLVPAMRRWPVIVELHDFVDASITETIVERFSPTHRVQIVEGTGRDPSAVPELAGLDARAQAAVLSEFRPGRMRWGVLTPLREDRVA